MESVRDARAAHNLGGRNVRHHGSHRSGRRCRARGPEATRHRLARDRSRSGARAGARVEIVRGDASETESLGAAFSGAQAAFVMLVPPYQARDVVADSRVLAQVDRRCRAHGTGTACRGAVIGRRPSQRGQRHRAGSARFRSGPCGRRTLARVSATGRVPRELAGRAAGGARRGRAALGQGRARRTSRGGVGAGCRPRRGGPAARSATGDARRRSRGPGALFGARCGGGPVASAGQAGDRGAVVAPAVGGSAGRGGPRRRLCGKSSRISTRRSMPDVSISRRAATSAGAR